MAEQRSDRELAQLVVGEGDEGAFRVLYRRHNPAVYRFVLRMVGGDAAEAEDIMQETWLRAARALDRFRWESALSSWLSGIALNRVRELARKKKRSQRIVRPRALRMLGGVDSEGERMERKGDVGMGWMKSPFWPEGGVR